MSTPGIFFHQLRFIPWIVNICTDAQQHDTPLAETLDQVVVNSLAERKI